MSEPTSTTEAPPLWSFVPLADHAPPTLPVSSAAAQSWATLRKLLKRDDEDQTAPARQEQALRALSDLRLAHFVRPIDWAEVSLALDGAVTTPGVTFVVGQPHGGHAEIVDAWAQRHKARLIEPPSPAQILRDERHWHPAWKAAKRPWALPRLEHCFLRHADGLSLVRRLLEDMVSGRTGPGLVGCDSWAWAFLQRVWPLPRSQALTLQALDAERMQRLLQQLAPAPKQGMLRFLSARNGSPLLSLPVDGESPSAAIAALSAHCRGNAGVAREYWRRRLRAEPGADGDADADVDVAVEAAPAVGDETAAASEQVVWISSDALEPVVPAGPDEDMSLLLHGLMLHGGLPDAVLPDLLPWPRHHSLALLLRLQSQGVVGQQDGRWLVLPLACEMVRSWLRERDYLIDDF